MEWHVFLSDPEIDTSLGYQPPEKHLFGKMVHDILESINALLGWSRMGEELNLTAEFPEPARTWLLGHVPTLQRERAHIYALSADFLDRTETLESWLGMVDEMGKSTQRVATLDDDLRQLQQAVTPVALNTIQVIRCNLRKLELIGKDIHDREYKRLWSLDYRNLVQAL